MKTIEHFKQTFATVSMFVFSIGSALADNGGGGNPVVGRNSGPGGGGNVGGATSAPEIDITQGLAIIAILVCAALIVRERMVRTATR